MPNNQQNLANNAIKEILEEVNNCIEKECFLASLYLLVTIPDICSSLETEDNRTDRSKYIDWFNNYMSKIDSAKYGENGSLKGSDFYQTRCSLLQQGQTINPGDYEKLFFFHPRSGAYGLLNTMHCCRVAAGAPDQSMLINIKTFNDHINDAVNLWLKDMEENIYFEENLAKLFRFHPNGIPGFQGPCYG